MFHSGNVVDIGWYWVILGMDGSNFLWLTNCSIHHFAFSSPTPRLARPTFITEDLGWLPRIPLSPVNIFWILVKVNNGQRGSCHGFCIISDKIPASWDTGESSMARTILLFWWLLFWLFDIVWYLLNLHTQIISKSQIMNLPLCNYDACDGFSVYSVNMRNHSWEHGSQWVPVAHCIRSASNRAPNMWLLTSMCLYVCSKAGTAAAVILNTVEEKGIY